MTPPAAQEPPPDDVLAEEGAPDPVLIVRALLELKARRDAQREPHGPASGNRVSRRDGSRAPRPVALGGCVK